MKRKERKEGGDEGYCQAFFLTELSTSLTFLFPVYHIATYDAEKELPTIGTIEHRGFRGLFEKGFKSYL